ncbi:tripartite tricarboxylate transporter substrate binding protein [Verticiella sediminum]|uniref:Tripartite tricarboxylate transporter substrate binding protein n=1 Tax=Verticiella sediminum TaxID=1247510 RepID=A0A556AVY1_9BURK|nr:tripartite tricarboxylate transporter substrate binding protein [Verticiella sediminum]TSH97108.1 tripartite tricarboxylate transporter substrate binding protein [Verticiella sediminum]
MAKLAALACAAAVAATTALPAFGAEDYPSRAVQLVIPYDVGGGVDAVARILAAHMNTAFGQPFVVDARPGGATHIGTNHVARAKPDGYTLLLTGVSTMSLQPLIFAGITYDAIESFEPIGMVSRIPMFVSVADTAPYRDLPGLIDGAKGKPGGLSYASNGNGSLSHLSTEVLAARAGIDLTHVPYKGFAPAIPDLVSGRVDMLVSDLAAVSAPLQGGSVRLLAVTSVERSPFQPDVPTVAESGYPEYQAENWLALYAPAGTPAPVVERLGDELRQFLKSDPAREAFARLGHVPDPTDGAAVTRRVVQEQKTYAPALEAAGLGAR